MDPGPQCLQSSLTGFWEIVAHGVPQISNQKRKSANTHRSKTIWPLCGRKGYPEKMQLGASTISRSARLPSQISWGDALQKKEEEKVFAGHACRMKRGNYAPFGQADANCSLTHQHHHPPAEERKAAWSSWPWSAYFQAAAGCFASARLPS